jgi:hypothetical protein
MIIVTARRRMRSASLALLFCIVFGLAQAEAQKDSGGLFQPDKGKFSLLLDGKAIGREEFEIAPSGAGWLARGTTTIKSEKGSETRVVGNLTLQPDGSPIAYDWSSQTDKTNSAHILFANGIAKITLEMQGARPYEQSLTFGAPLVAVLDNNLYHQYAVLARIYDWNKRGAQQLPVLIPQDMTPGTITLEATGSASAEGRTYEGLRVATSDLEIDLLLDRDHKLMRLEVPSAKVSVVRE